MQVFEKETTVDVTKKSDFSRLDQMSISELGDRVCQLNRELLEKCFGEPQGVSLSESPQRAGLNPNL